MQRYHLALMIVLALAGLVALRTLAGTTTAASPARPSLEQPAGSLSATPTLTALATATDTPPATTTAEPSATPTLTALATATDTPPATTTAEPSVTTEPSATFSPTLVASPTATRTPSPTPSATRPPACQPAWRIVPAPGIGVLSSVDPRGPADVWVTGGTTIAHWDGATWTVHPHPTPIGALGYGFEAISALPNDVWVVGAYGTTTGTKTLTEHWDGTTWQVIPSPNSYIHGWGRLNSVAAIAADNVWAAGGDPDLNGPAFFLHWDGTAWARTGGPGGRGAMLYGMTMRTPSDGWVAGGSFNWDYALVLHWNGSGWSMVNLGPFSTEYMYYDAAGAAANDAWAVGEGAIHWDGTGWTEISPTGIGVLHGVAAPAGNQVWVIGDPGFVFWDGTAWTHPPAPTGTYHDIAALATDDIWAVGPDIAHYSLPQAFQDVPPAQPFYRYIQWMGCRTIISGYGCGQDPNEPCVPPDNLPYFRPGANVTRGQLLKMVVNALGWTIQTPPTPTFADVSASNPFYSFIETGVAHGIINGYQCGGPGEPCDAQNRPYFRWGNDITRGQLSKVIALAQGYALHPPPTPTFADVPPTQPFYAFVEAIYAQGIVSGYTCGGPGEPCDPQNRPYFRPGASATRGQVGKFITLARGGPAH